MKQYRQAQFKHLWQRKRPKFWYVMPPQPSWPLATLREALAPACNPRQALGRDQQELLVYVV